jgi:hypothetical protein
MSTTPTTFYRIPIVSLKREFDQTSLLKLHKVIQFLRPKASPARLVRVGDNRDGAYLIPDDLLGINACFSPGVNNFKDFEDALVRCFQMRTHMCDRSTNIAALRTPLMPNQQTFLAKWLEPMITDDSITLEEWVNYHEPTSCDLLLQMDIEGAEYRNILASSTTLLRRFRIIVLELHGLSLLGNPAVMEDVFFPFVERLACDFVTIHAHPNNWSNRLYRIHNSGFRVPYLLELTLLRKDRYGRVRSSEMHTPELPHPLDIDRNVFNEPPLFLDDNWLDEPRSLRSRIRMLESELAYYKAAYSGFNQ